MEEEIQGKYLGYLDSIQDLIKDIQAGDVQGVPEQKLAELNDLYSQAQTQFEQGIGAYQPYVDTGVGTMAEGVEAIKAGQDILGAAPGLISSGQDVLGQAADIYSGLGTAPTMEQIQPFINPYQQAVQDEINRAYDIAANKASAGAIGAGAFGGGREGIQRSQLERDRASALAQSQGQAFEKGLQQYLASQSAAAGGLGNVAGQFGTFGTQLGQLGGQAGQFGLGLGQLGSGQAGLGFDVQKAGIADVSTLLDFANLQQQQQQKGFDVDYANQLAQYQQPFTELGFLGSAFGYAPSIPSYSTAGGGGGASPLQQIIGYGSLGLGALSGLKGLQGLF
tara:strand:- start:4745 stop:5752 length:1008 start_codon:yes stop_codon:yes gene_type:complete